MLYGEDTLRNYILYHASLLFKNILSINERTLSFCLQTLKSPIASARFNARAATIVHSLAAHLHALIIATRATSTLSHDGEDFKFIFLLRYSEMENKLKR